jgi:hypothetical protein
MLLIAARPSRSASVVDFARMACWGPEVDWHERDVVVPAFRRWLEAQGWETETEAAFVDVVARRGNETIYAEVKGQTKSRPGRNWTSSTASCLGECLPRR